VIVNQPRLAGAHQLDQAMPVDDLLAARHGGGPRRRQMAGMSNRMKAVVRDRSADVGGGERFPPGSSA
jgi:hypothetical protein